MIKYLLVASTLFAVMFGQFNLNAENILPEDCSIEFRSREKCCKPGPKGDPGHRGHRGATGATGATGPAGLAGALGAGAIIPFASGSPVTLTTVVGGALNTGAIIGFGTNVGAVPYVSGTVDLSTLSSDLAFVVPRDGTITSLAAFFSTTAGIDLTGSTVTIRAQVYISSPTSNAFTPSSFVNLTPSLTGLLTTGEVSTGLVSGLSVPVTAGDRVLVLFSSTVTGGTDIVSSIVGFASAGLGID